jgi:hypothetical protein
LFFKGDKEILGLNTPASSETIVNYFFSYGQGNCGPGKYLEWTYLKEPAAVNGTCNTILIPKPKMKVLKPQEIIPWIYKKDGI